METDKEKYTRLQEKTIAEYNSISEEYREASSEFAKFERDNRKLLEEYWLLRNRVNGFREEAASIERRLGHWTLRLAAIKQDE